VPNLGDVRAASGYDRIDTLLVNRAQAKQRDLLSLGET
jgi:hypothetical protein